MCVVALLALVCAIGFCFFSVTTKSADGRVATEAAWLNGTKFGKRRNKEEERKNGKNERKDLTLTGLLIEGLEDSRTAAHTKLRAERCARSSEAQFLERIFNAPVFLTVLKFRSSVHPSAIWNERAREDSLPFTPNLSGSSAPPPNEVLGKTQN